MSQIIKSSLHSDVSMRSRASTWKYNGDSLSVVSINTLSSISIFGLTSAFDDASVSTIVEKLVNERLKLGKIKSAKTEAEDAKPGHIQFKTDFIPEKPSSRGSSLEDVPYLGLCLDRFKQLAETKGAIDGYNEPEPEFDPENVIKPNFDEPEDDEDAPYKDPFKDTHMLLNKAQSFYTPTGFKDVRIDLRNLENEKENMWKHPGKDRYTELLYEEAIQMIKNVKIKSTEDDVEEDDVIVFKSVQPLMNIVKHKELSPQLWDPPEDLLKDKNSPFWVTAPPEKTNKAINTIRFIYDTLSKMDLTQESSKLKKMRAGRLSLSSEDTYASGFESLPEEESEIEDEPYLLKRGETVFNKKKANENTKEVVEMEEEIIQLEEKMGLYNIQLGHQLSISHLHKLYPEPEHEETLEEFDEEQEEYDVEEEEDILSESRPLHSSQTIINENQIRSKKLNELWPKFDEIDSSLSEESFYNLDDVNNEEWKEPPGQCPNLIRIDKDGFPVLRQRPKWITVQTDCKYKESDGHSTVERYRCLCLERGLPPFELIARNINKRSAIFNRLGRGPENTIKTLSQVLGKQTKLIDLTGYYLSKVDLCYLSQALKKLPNLSKLILQRTELTEEKLEPLIEVLPYCLNICLIDLSYNLLNKISADMIKSLPPKLKSLNLSHCGLKTDSFPALLNISPELKSIDVSWNKLYAINGLKSFVGSLIKKKSGLKELRIGWNSIAGEDGARCLADLVITLDEVLLLDISYNGFSTAAEMKIFNEMLLTAPKLKYFLLSGNPLGKGAAEALLKDLRWNGKPNLLLVDFGDFWFEKELFQICLKYHETYGISFKIGGIKTNADLKSVGTSQLHLRRLNFLNTPKRKSKKFNKKEFGYLLSLLLNEMKEEDMGLMKATKFKIWLESQGLKLEDGLSDALVKSLSDSNKNVNVQLTLKNYRSMFPEQIIRQKAKPEKKKKKKRIEEPVEEEPIFVIMEEKEDLTPSEENIQFIIGAPNKSFLQKSKKKYSAEISKQRVSTSSKGRHSSLVSRSSDAGMKRSGSTTKKTSVEVGGEESEVKESDSVPKESVETKENLENGKNDGAEISPVSQNE